MVNILKVHVVHTPCFVRKTWILDMTQPEVSQETLRFPGPLMSDTMQKEELQKFILERQQLCLKNIYDTDQVENYFFWQIMELFCHKNGRVNMCKIAPLLFSGYSMIREKAPELSVNLRTWCIPLAQLLSSSLPNDKHREAVIMMGDDLASRGLIYAAHICYVVAKVELGSRRQFQLIGFDRIPFGLRVLEQALIRTEMYEYILSLTSGFAQPSFQIFKLCHASRLALFFTEDLARKYCETIALSSICFSDCLTKTFFEWLFLISSKLYENEIEKPEWLCDLWQLNKMKSLEANVKMQNFQCCQKIGGIPSFQSHYPDAFSSRYTIRDALGKEFFNNVYTGVRNKDSKMVTIKYIKKDMEKRQTSTSRDKHKVPLEVTLLKTVSAEPRCRNIIELLDWFEMPDHMILVLEQPSPCMNLKEFFQLHNNCLSEVQARGIMRQVVQATRHCAARGVIHRDIKADNLLINTDTLEVKLKGFSCGDWLWDTPYTDYSGANLLIPPEFLLHRTYMGIPATIWNLGIVLYNLVTGDDLIKNEEDFCNGLLNLRPDVSSECFELIIWCLELNPELRPSFEDILGHKWFEGEVQDRV